MRTKIIKRVGFPYFRNTNNLFMWPAQNVPKKAGELGRPARRKLKSEYPETQLQLSTKLLQLLELLT